MIIDLVVGCRPNFVKAAAILHAAEKYPNVKINMLHTGQHWGEMSEPFFEELRLPAPKHILGSCASSVAVSVLDRFATTIAALGNWFRADKADYAMVVGDTASTLAGALAAKKIGIPLIHVEAGLRCGDAQMQEEINRILVDSVSDVCYTTSEAARDNLIAEGSHANIQFVGNVMVDTLYRFLPEARAQYAHFSGGHYAVLTLHRAESVDRDHVIFPMLDAIREVANDIPVVWPVHPRLKSRLGLWKDNGMFSFVEPMGYLQFISLLSNAKFVMTDSGGVQEETTALGVPCLTLRNNTERPETVGMGTNTIVGRWPKQIISCAQKLRCAETALTRTVLPFWDGHAADRIMSDLAGGLVN